MITSLSRIIKDPTKQESIMDQLTSQIIFLVFSYFSLNSTSVSLIFQHVPSSLNLLVFVLHAFFNFTSCSKQVAPQCLTIIAERFPFRLLRLLPTYTPIWAWSLKAGTSGTNAELRDLSYQYNLFNSIQQYKLKVHTKYLPAARVEKFEISEF